MLPDVPLYENGLRKHAVSSDGIDRRGPGRQAWKREEVMLDAKDTLGEVPVPRRSDYAETIKNRLSAVIDKY